MLTNLIIFEKIIQNKKKLTVTLKYVHYLKCDDQTGELVSKRPNSVIFRI